MAGTEIARIPVAIVGGGPIGLVLALFLDFYGVRSILFNTEAGRAGIRRAVRKAAAPEQIRTLALPTDHPTDVAYFTRLSGVELARFRVQPHRRLGATDAFRVQEYCDVSDRRLG